MKKSIRAVIITIIFIAAIFFIFNAQNNITGMPALFQNSVGKHPYLSSLILIFIYVLLISLRFSTHTGRGRPTKHIKDELDRFKVSEQYDKELDSLKKYVDYSVSQGRDESDIKGILSEQGWDKSLVDRVIDEHKSKNKLF